MKAIETRYRDFRFRSRTEARWAVFMDALGVVWEYELEGVELDTGQRYLPDFWLPQQQIWLEIKPLEWTEGPEEWPGYPGDKSWPREEDCNKAEALARVSGYWVIILAGTPGHPQESNSYEGFATFPSGGWDFQYWWCECPICAAVGIEWQGMSNRIFCPHRSKGQEFNYDSPRILEAYAAARAARFEHGESPDPKQGKRR